MTEYKLDRQQDSTPYDVVHELNDKYECEYDILIDAEKAKRKVLAKEANRCKRNAAFLSFRRLVYLVFVLLFMATSLTCGGFAADRDVGLVILVLIALMLIADIVFLILAVFRQMYFRTAFMLARIMLGTCAVIICVTSEMAPYIVVSMALALANVLNHAYATTRYTAKSQILPALISFAAITVAALGLFGVISQEVNGFLHERESHSRFVTYDINQTEGEKSAILEGVMLTANDILALGDKEVYEVADMVNEEIPVTGVGLWAFFDTTSIKTVVLPATVTQINAGAFSGSEVQTVEVHASEIYITDGFEGSSVKTVILLNPKATKIVLGDGSSVAENITFFVPEDLVWECRAMNPELADNIVPIQE